MDVFGSSGSLVAHSAAVETFVNPTSTNRPDLCERYLWALAQTKVPETQIVQGKKGSSINGKGAMVDDFVTTVQVLNTEKHENVYRIHTLVQN
jgi:hypothetical protein